MRAAIVGFALGAGWLQTRATLPDFADKLGLVAIALLTALLVIVLRRRLQKTWSTYAATGLLLMVGGIVGFVWAALFAHHYLARELPRALENQDLTVIGTVDSLPYRFERGVRFNFAVEKVVSHGLVSHDLVLSDFPSRLALSWYSNFRADERARLADRQSGLQPELPPDVQPGERWQLTVRLRRPHGNANPYGFDYEVWLLEQNLRATGSVRQVDSNLRLDSFVFNFRNLVQRSRSVLRERILAALPEQRYATIIVALVIGDQRGIDQSDWDVFNRTGISHLVSISGLHITMVAGLFAALLFGLWRRSFFTRAQLPEFLPAQKAAALAGAMIALLYVLLAGFGVPAQRTLYMLSVVAVALWCGRAASASHVLCAALGVVVLLDPWAVLWPGFWLSFGAVAVIFYATTGRQPMRSPVPATPSTGSAAPAAVALSSRLLTVLNTAGRTQYAVTIGLVPLTMLLFGRVSLVGPLANAIAIPLIGLLVTPLALVGSVLPAPFSGWLLGSAHQLVEWLARVLVWFSELPAAVWSAPQPSWWAFGLAALGALWLLAPRGWPARWLGLIAWLPLLVASPSQPGAKEMWVTAFDVGQGTALLIETAQHRMLYDTGPGYSPESNAGGRVLVPYLKARGIDRLDAVMISHSDTDHSGGAQTVFDSLRIDRTWSSLPLDSALVQSAPFHQRCAAGQQWVWDAVRFEVLHPQSVSYNSDKWRPNARSCTLKLTLGKHAMLLAGDIEAVQETELVEGFSEKLRASVLLAPHHGSGTSSTAPFLAAVAPDIAVFQVGHLNRYKHPKQEVFDRYGALGITRLRSDKDGAVTLRFGQELVFDLYRDSHARYWYGR